MFFKLSRKYFFALAIAIFLSIPVLAQNTGSISGTVTDQNGAVIIGATVKAISKGSSREYTATSDSEGKYQIINLPAGTYRVSATNEGFAANADNIRLGRGESVSRDFSLAPGTIQDTVTVTAGKGSARVASEVPQTVSVTTSEDIENLRPRSTFEAYERAPSVITVETNPARQRPRLRGLDSSRVLVVIDGEKLNNARTDLNTGLSTSIVDVSQLEAVEVIGGSGSSLYGSDSLAGTINLVTKAPRRSDDGSLIVGGRFDGSYSSNGAVRRGNATLNISNDQVAFRAGATMFRNANYNIGDEAITLADTRAIGDFYNQFPGNNARGFPIFEVPAGGEILNGAASGFNKQFDVWFYPSDKHNFRGRYIGNRHSNLGNAFSGPPYETQERFNLFRHYRKFGLRYEGLDLSKYIPRVAISYYNQRTSFPQDNYVWSIVSGSSFTGTGAAGDPIRFVDPTSPSVYSTPVGFTSNGNTIVTDAFNAQATFQPFGGFFVTTGYQFLTDDSSDNFNRFNVSTARVPDFTTLTRGASSPDTTYENNALFLQAEFDRIKWIKIIGGFRLDNWQTEARPTAGFPLGVESFELAAAVPIVTANPGPFTSLVPNLQQFSTLAAGGSSATTDNTSFTGNISAVLRLPYGINPYVRYATSYREPSITERYLLRDFVPKPGVFSALVVGNPGLEPEEGKNFDIGVKVQGNRYSGSFAYFRNDLENLIRFADQTLSVPANPAVGLLPIFQFGPVIGPHLISFNARINQAENLITGYEATGQVSIPLGDFGSLNPFTTMSWLYGENKSPTQSDIDIINLLYNRTDTIIPLEGAVDDVPLGGITPFRTTTGVQFTDTSGKLFLEYFFRHQGEVKRAAPGRFTGASLINIGTFRGLNSFTTHSIRGGYNWKFEKYRFSLNAGIDNLADSLFWEHFQTAPSPGRSFVVGTTIEIFNFLKK